MIIRQNKIKYTPPPQQQLNNDINPWNPSIAIESAPRLNKTMLVYNPRDGKTSKIITKG
jgi:hypothetical protein